MCDWFEVDSQLLSCGFLNKTLQAFDSNVKVGFSFHPLLQAYYIYYGCIAAIEEPI